MHPQMAALPDGSPTKRALDALLSGRLRIVLEQDSIRIGIVAFLLVLSSVFSLIPSPAGVDWGWMFIVPVAISAIAGGLKEGLLTAVAASLLSALYLATAHQGVTAAVVLGVISARFALCGLTAAVLGAFAEAHYL